MKSISQLLFVQPHTCGITILSFRTVEFSPSALSSVGEGSSVAWGAVTPSKDFTVRSPLQNPTVFVPIRELETCKIYLSK